MNDTYKAKEKIALNNVNMGAWIHNFNYIIHDGLTVKEPLPESFTGSLQYSVGLSNQIDFRIALTKLTFADFPDPQTCPLHFIVPFSSIQCPFDMFLGLKERGRP